MLWSSFLQKQVLSRSLPGIYWDLMSVLWKKAEFYKGDSDREVIVIVAGGLREGDESLLQTGRFSHYGALSSHQNFSPPRESLSSPYYYLKWNTK